MESYQKMNRIYHEIKQGRKQVLQKDNSRQMIEQYQKGFCAGYGRGWAACLKANKQIISGAHKICIHEMP